MKKKSIYAIVLAVLILIFLNLFIENKGIYIFPGDSFEQMYQFYLGGWERTRTLSLSSFDWSLGVGGNVMAYVYYYLTSPFFYITVLFPREAIKYLILDLNILKMFLLFVFSYYWAGKLTANRRSRLICSFMITFSGWVFFYFAYNMFLDAFLFYPLVLAFTEDYLKNDKPFKLVIGIGIIGLINYYFLYMFIPFLCLYALFRYLIIHREDLNFKNTFVAGAKFTGYALLGVGLCSIILIPCGYLIMTNSRFSRETIGLFDTVGVHELIYFFSILFSPVYDRFDASFFIPVSTHEFIGWGGGCSLYMMIMTPVLLPLVFKLKDKFKRNTFFVSYVILGVMILFQFIWYLLQRTIDTRWMYMILFVNAMCVMEVNDAIERKEISFKSVFVSSLATIMIISAFVLNTAFRHYRFRRQLIEMGIVSLLLIGIIFCYLFIHYRNKKSDKTMILLLAIEALAVGRVFVAYNYPIDHTFFEQKEFSTDAIDYIKSIDDGYYRVLYGSESYTIDGMTGEFVITTPNEPFSKNYPGFSFYNTVYNAETEDFYNRSRSNWFVSEAMGKNKVYDLMSAKYWITYDYETQIPDDYVMIHDDKENGFKIYQNPHFIELGKTYDKTINYDYFKTLPFLEQDRVMLDYLVTDQSDNTEYELNSELELLGIFPDENYRELVFNNTLNNGNVYIVNYGIPELDIKLYYQDELVVDRHYSQFNYIDFKVYEDTPIDKIVVEGENQSGVPAFMEVYYEPDNGEYTAWINEVREEKFENVYFDRDYISADIELNEDKWVFTSIPYDKGWSVTVDGKPVSYDKVNLGFIGLQLESGKHHLEFTYKIPGLMLGSTVSLASLIILATIFWIRNKKKN